MEFTVILVISSKEGIEGTRGSLKGAEGVQDAVRDGVQARLGHFG